MTPTSTSTSVHVRTRTATFLSELVMGTIGDILAELGIDLMRLYSNWAQDQAAIKAWIEEGSLEMVIMECHRPDGVVKPIFEFPINYEAGGSADKAFVESRASMARYRAKRTRCQRTPVSASSAPTTALIQNSLDGAPVAGARPPGWMRSASGR